MAVVSISRIQVRRGRASDSGIPQLASGEFGWAVDTQELYIGNGATSEGAPAVGNTQVLTENSNILDLIAPYYYRDSVRSDSVIEGTVPRSLGSRLDDRVSVRAFGLFTDESPAAQTDRLQRAIFELFLRSANSGNQDGLDIAASSVDKRVELHVEAGLYSITQTVYIPPYVTLVGAGKDKTIFRKTGQFHMFQTINEETQYDGDLASTRANIVSQPSFSTSTASKQWQSRHVRFEHMTLETTSTTTGSRQALISLQSCRDSVFQDVKFKGGLSNGTPLTNEYALEIVSKSYVVRTGDNSFINCDFVGLDHAVYGGNWAERNIFERCDFNTLSRGVVLGEELIIGQDGPRGNVIMNSEFSNIKNEAFVVPVGTGNVSTDNTYRKSVGTEGGSSDTAVAPVVVFGEAGNISSDDIFERVRDFLSVPALTSGPYHPEVKGPIFFTHGRAEQITLNQVTEPVLKFRLPADATKFYEVEYFYRGTTRNTTRYGVLNISINREDNSYELTDEFESNVGISEADALTFNLQLQSKLDSNGVQVYSADIHVANRDEEGIMTFKVTSKS